MGFEEFLPEEEKTDLIEEPVPEKISQNQVYDVIVGKKPDWQSIIYELINTEQLDPWDIDLVVLTNKYFEKIIELEDDPDFYISSKVLLASALLLRIKSEFLLNKHIRTIDEILFGKKQDAKTIMEKIEIDETELPLLIPKTPMPRLRKVTLPELMEALNKAISTESRRIKREVSIKRARKLSEISIPKYRTIDLKDRIKEFYARILTSLSKKSPENLKKIPYSKITNNEKQQKLACFLPLLHLSNNKKLWLEQTQHLDEIWIYLYNYFENNRKSIMSELEEDIEEMKHELENMDNTENINEETSGLEKARKKLEERKNLQEEIRKELEHELTHDFNSIITEIVEIEEKEKIEKITGFENE